MTRVLSALGLCACLLMVPAGSALAAPPANDNFASAIAIPVGGATLDGTNVEATGEAGEPSSSGSLNSVWYSWTPTADTQVVIHTCDSAFDTVLAVYTGSAVNALTLVGNNDDNTSGFCGLETASQIILSATANTTYRIRVDGFMANTGAFKLTVDPGNGATTPNPVAFGTVPRGTVSQSREVRFLNTSGASLTVNRVTTPGDYFVTDDGCSGVAVAAAQVCRVRVRFAPEVEGARPANLSFFTSGGTTFSALTGIGGPLPQGPPGTNGTNGTDGTDGTNGADGSNGTNGSLGPAGPAGPQGPQGAPGRDARVTCRPAKGKGAARKVKVTCKVTFTAAKSARVRAVLLRGHRVVATGRGTVRRGRVNVPLLRNRRLARGRYDLLLTFVNGGKRVTIEQRVRIR